MRLIHKDVVLQSPSQSHTGATHALLARLRIYVPGLILSTAIAVAAIELGQVPWLTNNGISALTLAILLGMIAGNTFYPKIAASSATGVGFSKQHLLRLGIILYGLRLTFQDIAHVGVAGVIIDAVVLSSTFCLSWFLGTRVFKLDRKTAMLIGAGSSICGAAAVMAAEPVIKGRAEQVTVAVSTVVVFGTLAIFLYPAIYNANAALDIVPMSHEAFGIFTGSTIHEVAQVVAAANAVSPEAANAAVIAKMVRVMMLAPFLIILSAWLARDQRKTTAGNNQYDASGKITIPWFSLIFVVVAGFNSLHLLPQSIVSIALDIDTLLLAMAMAALGLTTHVSAIAKAGVKPLLLAATLFIWLVAGGLGINLLMTGWFA